MCSYSANDALHLAILYHWLARRKRVSVIRGVEQYYVGPSTPWNQEIIKVREVIPHTGPIPIVIPLRLFLDDINFPADNVTARVTWKFRGGGKVQQILYRTMLLSVFKIEFHGLIKFIVCKIQVSNIHPWSCLTV